MDSPLRGATTARGVMSRISRIVVLGVCLQLSGIFDFSNNISTSESNTISFGIKPVAADYMGNTFLGCCGLQYKQKKRRRFGEEDNEPDCCQQVTDIICWTAIVAACAFVCCECFCVNHNKDDGGGDPDAVDAPQDSDGPALHQQAYDHVSNHPYTAKAAEHGNHAHKLFKKHVLGQEDDCITRLADQLATDQTTQIIAACVALILAMCVCSICMSISRRKERQRRQMMNAKAKGKAKAKQAGMRGAPAPKTSLRSERTSYNDDENRSGRTRRAGGRL